MRINRIEDQKVDVTLNTDELNKLATSLYLVEKHCDEEGANVNAMHHELAAQITLARDVALYGHMDNFATSQYMKHKMAANPDAREYAPFRSPSKEEG